MVIRLMAIRIIIGGVGITLGVMTIFATDEVWALVEWVNALFGRQVKRTERWNARASYAGVILIGSGVLMLAVALVQT